MNDILEKRIKRVQRVLSLIIKTRIFQFDARIDSDGRRLTTIVFKTGPG